MTRRERAALILAALGAAGGVAGAVYGDRGRRKAASLSQAEIDALTASAETELATSDADAHRVCYAGWVVLHEAPPGGEPWFWFAAAAGGPDLRYMMRAVRTARGFAATKTAAHARLHEAVHALAEPEESAP